MIDGGSEIFNYKVEKKEATHRAWMTVTPECIKTACKVCLLDINCFIVHIESNMKTALTYF